MTFEIVPMDGFGNLFSDSIKTKMRINHDRHEKNVVVVDTDYSENDGGFAHRRNDIAKRAADEGVDFIFFLFPNNSDDGIFENLLDSIARKDRHRLFFDCFADYENCMKSQKDGDGKPLYQVPNLKGKLHTYINAVPMEKRLRKMLGRGDWQFENAEYWDLDHTYLTPLKSFLETV